MMSFWNCKEDARGGGHHCGAMLSSRTIIEPRCRVFRNIINKLDARKLQPHTNSWWKLLDDRSEIEATFPPHTPEEQEKARSSYARPGHCILDGKLIPGTQAPEYIAISYVWGLNTVWKEWCGRRVTEQALKLSERLSKYTTLPLWIDALCVPQNDGPVKMRELAKMADIYRGATLVLCLVPEVSVDACNTVARCNALMDDEGYANREDGLDIYGSFMFATFGEHNSLLNLFASRWWERAWTFQEAALNLRTFLVGEEEESIPIQHLWRIAGPVQRRAASVGSQLTMGKPASFWDSVSKMADASVRGLPLGDAMSCVWRRLATVEHDKVYSMLGVCKLSEHIRPDYNLTLSAVLMQLFESASSQGDYSWTFWCHKIHHDEVEDGLCMVPTPEQVRGVPFMSITKWESSRCVNFAAVKPGAERGILLPYRSSGVVTWESSPQSLPEMVKILAERGHKESEIWDLIFGIRVGLCVDINRTVHNRTLSDSESEGISVPLLRLTLAMVDGSCTITQDLLDIRGDKPFTPNLGFTNFAAMAAYTWEKGGRLTAISSLGGTLVVPEHSKKSGGSGPSRIHVLPIRYAGIECEDLVSPRVAFVARGDTPFHASAVGVMIQKQNKGLGSWQVRRIGSQVNSITAPRTSCDNAH